MLLKNIFIHFVLTTFSIRQFCKKFLETLWDPESWIAAFKIYIAHYLYIFSIRLRNCMCDYLFVAHTLNLPATCPLGLPSLFAHMHDSLFIIIKSGQRPINTYIQREDGEWVLYISSVVIIYRCISLYYIFLYVCWVRQLSECVFFRCGSFYVSQSVRLSAGQLLSQPNGVKMAAEKNKLKAKNTFHYDTRRLLQLF